MSKNLRIGSIGLEEMLAILTHFGVKKICVRDGFFSSYFSIELDLAQNRSGAGERKTHLECLKNDTKQSKKTKTATPDDEELQYWSAV